MANPVTDHLASLHTHAIDARNGYAEALKQSEGHGLTSIFREMVALHAENAGEIGADMRRLGELPDEGGSFMTTIHRTIMDIRSLFGGLGQGALPGLIDGEERNTGAYDKALALEEMPTDIRTHLTQQKNKLDAAIARMRAVDGP